MKKLLSVLLALMMIAALSAPAFADAETGSITISPANAGETYTIYKVFDITYSGSGTSQLVANSYTKTGDDDALYTALTAPGSPFTLQETSTPNVYNVSTTAAAATISDFLQGLVEAGTLTTGITAKTATEATVTFTGLELGYYYVKSSLGAIVSLNTTAPDQTIADKNPLPEVTKKVLEDDSDEYVSANTADVIDTIYYQTTIDLKNANARTHKLVLHDKMSGALSLVADSIVVKVDNVEVTPSDTTFAITTTGLSDDCTFEIAFEDEYISGLSATEIVVTYGATIDPNEVVIGVDGNSNETELKSGDNTTSITSETTTKVFKFGINKYTGTTANKLAGAKFIISKTVGEGDDAATKYATFGNDGMLTSWEDSAEAATVLVSSDTADIEVKGLDAGTYTIHETEAPKGYNLLTSDVTAVIAEDGAVSFNGTADADGIVDIENSTGTVLPSTGGIGTTIFTVVGIVLMAGAAALLITKKRVSGKES